jgi:hypothetical protein
MKRGTTEHPKMMMLASVLGIQKWGAVGLMESVWHFTAKYAPQGDIGKYSDEMIAAGIGWNEDPKRLIQALIDCQWAEMSGQGRLLIHDWSEHSDDYADKYLSRHGLLYADGRPARRPAITGVKKTTRGGQRRTRADKSRESESVSESVSPPNPRRGVEGEGDLHRVDGLVEALLATGKCPAVTREMVAQAFQGVVVDERVVKAVRLQAEGMCGQIGSLMSWLRRQAERVEKNNAAGAASEAGSLPAVVDEAARKAALRARREKIGGEG